MNKELEEAINFLNSAKQRRENKEYTGYGTLEDVDKLSAFEIGIVLKLLQKQQAELEKKDKIIDEMANSFAEEGFYSEHCQTLIDNEICPDDCNKCVKQYFKKKVEE